MSAIFSVLSGCPSALRATVTWEPGSVDIKLLAVCSSLRSIVQFFTLVRYKGNPKIQVWVEWTREGGDITSSTLTDLVFPFDVHVFYGQRPHPFSLDPSHVWDADIRMSVSTELAVSLIEEYRGHRVVGMELANEVISDQYRRVTGRAKPRFFCDQG